MKFCHPSSVSYLFAIVFLACARPLVAEETKAPDAAAPAYTDEQKTALKALDAEFARFDAKFQQDTDVEHKASVKEAIDPIKARGAAMHKAVFDQSKYDELRFDLNVEYQRLAQWLAPPIATPMVGKAPRVATVYGLRPSAANKADVAAALIAVDAEIKRLESLGSLDAPRIKEFKDRRAELDKEFTTARWDGLLAAMRR